VRKLTISLVLVVVVAVIGLGWGIDQWYSSTQVPEENQAIKTYRQLGRELIQLVSVANLDQTQLERWAEQSQAQIELTPYADFPLPSNLNAAFESGEPLLLDSGNGMSLHYFLPAQQLVVSFTLPTNTAVPDSGLRLALTLLFYSGVILLVLIWLYPLLKRLRLLRQQAIAFGAGNLSSRIPSGVSYIADIEQEFNRMAQRIETLVYDNKLLSRGLSHDLRTPIARLRFGLDVLQEADLSASQQKTLAHLNRDLVAMETLVETLLSYARMDQATINFNAALIDLARCVEDIVRDFYDEQVRLEIQPSNYAANIHADGEYLNMLVHNLIQNAERHGKGKVLVRIVATEKTVALAVEDNGPGIPADEREHVVKPFYRIASAQNTQGHGMGLAIVERIAHWHKAQLRLEQSAELGGLKISVVFARGTLL
jgi:signal transduction histidine kinase